MTHRPVSHWYWFPIYRSNRGDTDIHQRPNWDNFSRFSLKKRPKILEIEKNYFLLRIREKLLFLLKISSLKFSRRKKFNLISRSWENFVPEFPDPEKSEVGMIPPKAMKTRALIGRNRDESYQVLGSQCQGAFCPIPS